MFSCGVWRESAGKKHIRESSHDMLLVVCVCVIHGCRDYASNAVML